MRSPTRAALTAALFAALLPGVAGAQGAAPIHPLDPLTADELSAATRVLRADPRLTPEARFATLSLAEPSKAEVEAGTAGRAAEAVLFDWGTATGYRAVVDLRTRRVSAWEPLPTHQPPMRNLVISRLEEAVRADPRWAAALRRRGIADAEQVAALWASGEGDTLRRRGDGHQVAASAPFHRQALPPGLGVPGLRVEVDLTTGRVTALRDTLMGAPAQEPAVARALATAPRGGGRGARAPAGSAIDVRGTGIRWHRWRLHAGMHPRRGLDLWGVGYEDGGRVRSILYRAGIAEMIAPYGDPAFGPWFPRDEGDYGLGTYGRTSAVPGADAPRDARFVDAVVHDALGRPVAVPRAIAVYETRDGVLWRHSADSRASVRLVVSSFATIDNYDYVFSWIFADDGTIEAEVRLTGVMNLRPARPGDDAPADGHAASAHRVGPLFHAPHHQHFFSYRLDFDVDGAAPNRVVEMDTRPLPVGPANPGGEWFQSSARVIGSERDGRRSLDLEASRRWRVENADTTNALGGHTAYTLVPGESSVPFQAATSAAMRRAGFTGAHLWVTPYDPGEMYPAGDYPNLAPDGAGLPAWTARDRPLARADVVLWYTLGVTHLPRPEDYPVMPAYRAGFRLVPTGFFARNPALDAPMP